MSKRASYIIKHFPGNQGQLDYLDELTLLFNADTSRFFRHVLASTCVQKQHHGWIPISYELRRKELPGADWEALMDAGLLEMKGHEWKNKKSREFKIPDAIMARFLDLALPSLDEAAVETAIQEPRFNLMSGCPIDGIEKSALKDAHGRGEPPLIQEAMRSIPYGYYNFPATLAYLRQLKEKVLQLKVAYEAMPPESDEYKQLKSKYEHLWGRYVNDCSTFIRVFYQGHEKTQWPGIYRFPIAWTATRTGRISGGFQSASREMKAAVYKDIPGLRNYDLKRSQAGIVAYLIMAFAGDVPRESAEALFRFLFGLPLYYVDADGNVVTQYDLGLSDDLIKEVLYGVIFGGDPSYPDSEIVDALLEEVDKEQLPALQIKLGKMFGPLIKGIRTLSMKILEGYENEPAYTDQLRGIAMGREPLSNLKDLLAYSPIKTNKPYDFRVRRVPAFATHPGFGKGRKTYVTNATGKRFDLQEYPDRMECARKLLSHIIQGAEAAAMHQLAINLSRKGIQVISHEHDGLVVLGEITLEELKQAQAEATVLMWSFLAQKDFADMIKRVA